MPGFTMNTVAMSGNLTRDPELRSLPSGTAVCKIGLAVNERFKDEAGNWADRANFFDWTVWGGLGEWLANNLAKGDGIAVSGRARWHSWETQEGQKRSAVDFVAESIVPIGRRDGGGGNTAKNAAARGDDFQAGGDGGFTARSDIPVDTNDFAAAPAGGGGGVQPTPDDDIPF